MKRYIYLVLFPLLSLQVNAQLSLVMNYPLDEVRYFYISDNEGVYVNYSSYSDSSILFLYNDNHQLIRTIQAGADTILNVINVSKYLYNQDELYEIIYAFYTFENGGSHYNSHIIDENSNILENLKDQYVWIHQHQCQRILQ